jgi:hypothetical protein
MQSLGMPGVFTHGDFDTWSPGYLMFLAGLHNGISRLYETFGNGGADTEKRVLTPEQYSRTWYRQNPPPATVVWSQRDNNNYEESALLTTLSYFSHNTHHFLEDYYAKSKRSVQKPSLEGPAAYVLAANPAETNRQLQLLKVLEAQHVEIQQLATEVDVTLPIAKKAEKKDDQKEDKPETKDDKAPKKDDKPTTVKFPAGSYVIRLDQPYSRVADALLDKQYWAPDDPQKHPYDDTGWSYSQLFNVKVTRLTDPQFLQSKMTLATDLDENTGKLTGSGSVYAIANTGQTSILALLYQLKQAHFVLAEKPFDAQGTHFNAGSLLITDADEPTLTAALHKLRLDAVRLSAIPTVASHTVTAPRIAFMHTWLGTQTEGWWRQAFDLAGIPFTYMSTQKIASEPDLNSKYDVIIFAPVGRASSTDILDGVPTWTNPMPWRKTDLTPNLGGIDETADTRPGLGYDGLAKLKSFVSKGGLLITCEDTAQFAIDTGLAPGVSVVPKADSRVVGSVLASVFVAKTSPIAYGYGDSLPVISADGMAFNISNTLARGGGRVLMDPYAHRPTGRGGPDETDIPQGRVNVEPETPPKQQPWEAKALTEEQMRNNPQVLPAAVRPQVILRFDETKNLLLSGLLDKGTVIAEHAIVVDAHLGSGNVLLFANNPIYRGETIGSYNLVFNSILNHDHLNLLPADQARNTHKEDGVDR